MASNIGTVFEALRDPTRRQVVELLGSRPMRAGQLAGAAGVSAPAMSRHLRVLLDAGVVVDERRREDARLRVFHLRPEGLSDLEAWLEDLHTAWSRQLGSFKRQVEAKGVHD